MHKHIAVVMFAIGFYFLLLQPFSPQCTTTLCVPSNPNSTWAVVAFVSATAILMFGGKIEGEE